MRDDEKAGTVEVKIGIADSNRELVFKTDEPDDVRSRVETALTADAKAILEPEDEGRRYLVSTEGRLRGDRRDGPATGGFLS